MHGLKQETENLPLEVERDVARARLLSKSSLPGPEYLSLQLQLKRRLRRGWLRVGIPQEHCESVADHLAGVASLCLFLGDAASYQKACLMALAHELGEARVGDIIPADNIKKADKHKLEYEALVVSLRDLPISRRTEILELWQEYSALQTPLARFVKEMDLLEMGLQARVYLSEGYTGAQELLRAAQTGLVNSTWSCWLTDF